MHSYIWVPLVMRFLLQEPTSNASRGDNLNLMILNLSSRDSFPTSTKPHSRENPVFLFLFSLCICIYSNYDMGGRLWGLLFYGDLAGSLSSAILLVAGTTVCNLLALTITSNSHLLLLLLLLYTLDLDIQEGNIWWTLGDWLLKNGRYLKGLD